MGLGQSLAAAGAPGAQKVLEEAEKAAQASGNGKWVAGALHGQETIVKAKGDLVQLEQIRKRLTTIKTPISRVVVAPDR